MICMDCGETVNCGWMCDDGELVDDPVRCGPCFEKTSCGEGKHGEGCPTFVAEET